MSVPLAFGVPVCVETGRQMTANVHSAFAQSAPSGPFECWIVRDCSGIVSDGRNHMHLTWGDVKVKVPMEEAKKALRAFILQQRQVGLVLFRRFQSALTPPSSSKLPRQMAKPYPVETSPLRAPRWERNTHALLPARSLWPAMPTVVWAERSSQRKKSPRKESPRKESPRKGSPRIPMTMTRVPTMMKMILEAGELNTAHAATLALLHKVLEMILNWNCEPSVAVSQASPRRTSCAG